MWVKRNDGSYLNTTTNADFKIVDSPKVTGQFAVYANGGGSPVSSGWPTRDKAQDALDDFVAGLGEYIEFPDYDPELDTDNDSADEGTEEVK